MINIIHVDCNVVLPVVLMTRPPEPGISAEPLIRISGWRDQDLRMAVPSVSAVSRLPFRRFAVSLTFHDGCCCLLCRFSQHIISKILFSVSRATTQYML